MDLNEVQGLLARGHSDLKAAAYVMLRITKPEKARHWLGHKIHYVTNGVRGSRDISLNIAFTWSGLKKLGAEEFIDRGLSVEFYQGMATDARARILGDLGENSRENWNWGGPDTPEIDICLLVFARDEHFMDKVLVEYEEKYKNAGLEEVILLHSRINPLGREHFGFKDGIAQPYIEGLSKKGPAHNTVATGEFVLGYPNGYGKLGPSPLVPDELDPDERLPKFEKFGDFRDFGRNGSYMVFRQLEQDVPGFWGQIKAAVRREKGGEEPTEEETLQLAAKMMGRWPSGKPITLCPVKQEPYDPADEDFLFHDHDLEGFKCPVGAHVRRANPRDTIPDVNPKSSVRISNVHRILRRGRIYGPPLVESFEAEDLMKVEGDGQERGLNFICFNANISRQFEFIQHTWSNNTKYGGLYDDPDPILGFRDSRHEGESHSFTIEAEPLRRKVTGLQRMIHMKGGGYFFLPGLSALKFLAHYQAQNTKPSAQDETNPQS